MVNVDHPEDAVRGGGSAEKNCQRQQDRPWKTRKSLHGSLFESNGAEVQPSLVSGLGSGQNRTDDAGDKNYDDYATVRHVLERIMRCYDFTANGLKTLSGKSPILTPLFGMPSKRLRNVKALRNFARKRNSCPRSEKPRILSANKKTHANFAPGCHQTHRNCL